jgi:BolA protein
MTQGRVARMREKLEARFAPTALDIRDDSALHVGHAGARGGAGHYAVRIEAEAFRDLTAIQRHRLVYEALADMIPDQIHALSIDARPAAGS